MPSPGCGARAGRSDSVRMIPSSRRISASAWRPVSSTVISASRSRSCSGLSRRRTALACTVITLTEWASTSCSSRVIRPRSSSTAWRASSLHPPRPLLREARLLRVPRRRRREHEGAADRDADPDQLRRRHIRRPQEDEPRGREQRTERDHGPADVGERSSHPRREDQDEEHRLGVVCRRRVQQREGDRAGGDRDRDRERSAPAQEERAGGEERDPGEPQVVVVEAPPDLDLREDTRPRAPAPRRRSRARGPGREESRRDGTPRSGSTASFAMTTSRSS